MLELPRRSHAAYADRQDLAASRPTLTSATVGGSLIGGNGSDGGEIYACDLGEVAIAHDIRGVAGSYSGSVGSGHNTGSITVGGSAYGGKGNNSGDIYGAYKADGKIDNVSVGGSLIGGGRPAIHAGRMIADGSRERGHTRGGEKSHRLKRDGEAERGHQRKRGCRRRT